ncbi:MAG: hypothetical protein RLZZ628_1578 [Bacteroidota bacterium]|jgi:hypothetical protein
MQIVLNISNQQDWAILLPLLERYLTKNGQNLQKY